MNNNLTPFLLNTPSAKEYTVIDLKVIIVSRFIENVELYDLHKGALSSVDVYSLSLHKYKFVQDTAMTPKCVLRSPPATGLATSLANTILLKSVHTAPPCG